MTRWWTDNNDETRSNETCRVQQYIDMIRVCVHFMSSVVQYTKSSSPNSRLPSFDAICLGVNSVCSWWQDIWLIFIRVRKCRKYRWNDMKFDWKIFVKLKGVELAISSPTEMASAFLKSWGISRMLRTWRRQRRFWRKRLTFWRSITTILTAQTLPKRAQHSARLYIPDRAGQTSRAR